MGDRIVQFLYSTAREQAPALFRALSSERLSHWIGYLNFDHPFSSRFLARRFMNSVGIDLTECADPPRSLDTPRKIFERRIRYWECRPLPDDPGAVLCPADSRALVGSLREHSRLRIKGKFFQLQELLGVDKVKWSTAFDDGSFAVFRLTPEKYHYSHVPVSGEVVDVYQVPGRYHSCNPSAVVALLTPYSKNRRVVTVIQTDVPGGSGAGLVAMVEVVALGVGDVVQCYSEREYREPRPVAPGMFVRRGMPKSLFRPGSSTDVLLFQRGRIRFARDLVRNLGSLRARSRFSRGFGQTLVETEVRVRSLLGNARVTGGGHGQ